MTKRAETGVVVPLLEKSGVGEAPRAATIGVMTDLGVMVGGEEGVGGKEGRGLPEMGGEVGALKGAGNPLTGVEGLASLEGGEAGEAMGSEEGGRGAEIDDFAAGGFEEEGAAGLAVEEEERDRGGGGEEGVF